MLDFSKDIIEVAKEVMLPRTNDPVRIRVGLHTGERHEECCPCVILVPFSVLTLTCTFYANRVLAECPPLLSANTLRCHMHFLSLSLLLQVTLCLA